MQQQSKQVNARLPIDLVKRLETYARDQRRSKSSAVAFLLDLGLRKFEATAEATGEQHR